MKGGRGGEGRGAYCFVVGLHLLCPLDFLGCSGVQACCRGDDTGEKLKERKIAISTKKMIKIFFSIERCSFPPSNIHKKKFF